MHGLTAPTPTEDPAPAPAPPPAGALGTRWVSATKEARSAITWIATALAAVATVIFGAGPILTAVTADISGWEAWRFVLFFAGSILGAAGAVTIVLALLESLVPRQLTLAELPADFVAKLDQDPSAFPDVQARSMAEFLRLLATYKIGVRTIRERASGESDPERRAVLTKAAEQTKATYEKYRAYEAVLLDEAGYRATIQQIRGLRGPVLAGAVAAVVGVGLYLIATSPPTDPPAALTAQPAILVKGGSATSDELWDRIGLSACEVSGVTDRIPVLAVSGTGSLADPYVIKTIGGPQGCRVLQLTLTPEVGQLVLPQPEVVRITVQPSAGPTR